MQSSPKKLVGGSYYNSTTEVSFLPEKAMLIYYPDNNGGHNHWPPILAKQLLAWLSLPLPRDPRQKLPGPPAQVQAPRPPGPQAPRPPGSQAPRPPGPQAPRPPGPMSRPRTYHRSSLHHTAPLLFLHHSLPVQISRSTVPKVHKTSVDAWS